MLKWLFNVSAARRVFKTEWVEDLPASADKNTVYIVGGRRFPFNICDPMSSRSVPTGHSTRHFGPSAKDERVES